MSVLRRALCLKRRSTFTVPRSEARFAADRRRQGRLAGAFANLHVSIAGADSSSVASFLVAELGTAMHFEGFGGQLFNAVAGGFTGSVANQIAAAPLDWNSAAFTS
jgi:hypothetical protein